MKHSVSIADFSPHLFWDTDRSKIDFLEAKAQIIYQVVEFGLMTDWLLLQQVYSKDEIRETVIGLRSLEKITLNYLALYFNIEKSVFRCYTQSQSTQSFWNS